jgi:DNA methylase
VTGLAVGKRYDNSVPLPLVLRLVTSFSDLGGHVVDPFLGGTTAVACWRTGRRFTGGDLNPPALRFSAARLLSEYAWPDDRQPALPGAGEQIGPGRQATAAHAALQLDLFGGA